MPRSVEIAVLKSGDFVNFFRYSKTRSFVNGDVTDLSATATCSGARYSGLKQRHHHQLKRILRRRDMSKIRGIVPVVLATAIGVGNGTLKHKSVRKF